MQQRRIGASGPLVGEIGLGAMSFGGFLGPTDAATSHRTLDKALDLGITHVDTALIYGPFTSETVIGGYFKTNKAAKQKFSIATKGGINPSPRAVNNSPAFMRECLEASLKRLDVESVDLYYVHRRDHSVPIEDVMGTMLAFKAEGKIRGIGFSEISPASLQRAASVGQVDAVQNEYSLWTRLPELGMLQACKRHGAAFVAFSPLARGLLSDVKIVPADLPAADFRKGLPRLQEPNFRFNMEFTGRFKAYAKEHGWTVASLALAWLLARHDHVIPIPGTRTAEHLADDAAASDIKLTPEHLAQIEAILPVGFAHGNRYSLEQQGAAEHYC
jgi:aryl-alcohol dehydrogenase-like predicted oxidoreductase